MQNCSAFYCDISGERFFEGTRENSLHIDISGLRKLWSFEIALLLWNLSLHYCFKGGVIWEDISIFSHPQKEERKHCLSTFLLLVEKTTDSDLVRIFWGWDKWKIYCVIYPHFYFVEPISDAIWIETIQSIIDR